MRYLVVGAHRVAIANLDGIIEGAGHAEVGGEEAVRSELLRLARMHNYIPATADKAYEEALYREYQKRMGR